MENKKRRGPIVVPVEQRMARHYSVDENGCWMWHGSCNSAGYPQVKDVESKRPKFAHRLAYELHTGEEIPKGLVVDHLCYTPEGRSNRLCVNPGHMELVTQSENAKRAMAKRKELGYEHPLKGRPTWNKGLKQNKQTGEWE